MRKFLAIFAVLVTALACSCNNENNGFGIEYALNSDGVTDGHVVLTFPSGEFSLKGDANYQFEWTNVDKVVTNDVKSLDSALATKDVQVLSAANYVNAWLDSVIKITEADGNYDIYVKGYVKETLTGITFSVDKHFTNPELTK